jgi:hypothetical protein
MSKRTENRFQPVRGHKKVILPNHTVDKHVADTPKMT